jgi:hypothetical protein
MCVSAQIVLIVPGIIRIRYPKLVPEKWDVDMETISRNSAEHITRITGLYAVI